MMTAPREKTEEGKGVGRAKAGRVLLPVWGEGERTHRYVMSEQHPEGVRESACRELEDKRSRQRRSPVQRPWGSNVSRTFEESK